MTLLVRRPSPYDELFSLRQAVDRLSESPLSDGQPVPATEAAADTVANTPAEG